MINLHWHRDQSQWFKNAMGIVLILGWVCAVAAAAQGQQSVSEVSQYGITWTFDR